MRGFCYIMRHKERIMSKEAKIHQRKKAGISEEEAQRYLKEQFLGKERSRRVRQVLLAAAVVMMLVKAFLPDARPEDAVKFSPAGESGYYAYADIVLVSGPVYKVTDSSGGSAEVYYAAMDRNNQYMVVKMDEDTFAQLSDQYAYFQAGSSGEMPAPCRIYGVSASMGQDVRLAVERTWEMEDSQFFSYFGAAYLDTTKVPVSAQDDLLTSLAIVCAAVWLVMFLASRYRWSSWKKSLAGLKEEGRLAEAARELRGVAPLDKKYLTESEHYFFSRPQRVIIRIADIQLFYFMMLRTYGVKTGEQLVIYSRHFRGVPVPLEKDSMDKVEERIREENPDVLVGISRENTKAWKKMNRKVRKGGDVL